ncbi:hypothetical protein C8R44DRAFT_749884 [Mycena epipterygia]|nr:hypothetical protein C8R44DRAFT_749884 [Mycena epipterygia]
MSAGITIRRGVEDRQKVGPHGIVDIHVSKTSQVHRHPDCDDGRRVLRRGPYSGPLNGGQTDERLRKASSRTVKARFFSRLHAATSSYPRLLSNRQVKVAGTRCRGTAGTATQEHLNDRQTEVGNGGSGHEVQARADERHRTPDVRPSSRVRSASRHFFLPASMTPAFPPELEQEIFRITTLKHPKAIPILRVARVLVRHRHSFYLAAHYQGQIRAEVVVYPRIMISEPLSYRVVWAHDEPPRSSKATAILQAIESKSASFFQDVVRHLFLNVTSDWYRPFSGFFANITDFPSSVTSSASWRACVCRSVASPLRQLFSHRANAPVSRLYDRDRSVTWLPARSHAFGAAQQRPGAHSSCFSVRMRKPAGPGQPLVPSKSHRITSTSAQEFVRSPPVMDPRFVLDWEIGTNGGEDFQVAADLFIAKKQERYPNRCIGWNATSQVMLGSPQLGRVLWVGHGARFTMISISYFGGQSDEFTSTSAVKETRANLHPSADSILPLHEANCLSGRRYNDQQEQLILVGRWILRGEDHATIRAADAREGSTVPVSLDSLYEESLEMKIGNPQQRPTEVSAITHLQKHREQRSLGNY